MTATESGPGANPGTTRKNWGSWVFKSVVREALLEAGFQGDALRARLAALGFEDMGAVFFEGQTLEEVLERAVA